MSICSSIQGMQVTPPGSLHKNSHPAHCPLTSKGEFGGTGIGSGGWPTVSPVDIIPNGYDSRDFKYHEPSILLSVR